MQLLHYFIPHEANQHRPYLTRQPGLVAILIFALTVQTSMNIFFSTRPSILGFATNIYQQELIGLTNQERASNGLSSLKHNSALDEAARLKALDMFEHNYWAHISPDGVDPWYWFGVVGYSYNTAGENLARDFDTSAGVVDAWMASPSHRSNILYTNFTEIGIAVVNGTLNGSETTLVVQLFATPTPQAELAVAPVSVPSTPTPVTVAPTSTPRPVITIANPTATTSPQVPVIEEITITITPTSIPLSASPTPTPEAIYVAANNQTGIVLGPTNGQTTTPSNPMLVTLTVISSLQNMSTNRIFTIILLMSLIGLFLSDSIILWYKGIRPPNPHRIVHVGVLIIVLAGVVLGASGSIL